MPRVDPAPAAEFLQLETLGGLPLVLGGGVIAALAFGTCERNDVAHQLNSCRNSGFGIEDSSNPESRVPNPRPYSTISEIVPAPTVRPPSRIANRNPFSRATGVINSTATVTLSPGITISTLSGKVATPVTSVVRR